LGANQLFLSYLRIFFIINNLLETTLFYGCEKSSEKISIFTVNGANAKNEVFLNKYQFKDNSLHQEKGRKLSKYSSLHGYLVLFIFN